MLSFEPNMFLSAARAEGSRVPDIRYALLPTPRPPSVGGHTFAYNTGPLAETSAIPPGRSIGAVWPAGGFVVEADAG